MKITVIATGFQRDNLPQLARRATAAASASAYVEPIVFENAPPPPLPAPAVPVTEPLFSSGLSSGSSLFRELPPEPAEEPEIEEAAPMAMPVDDIEVPAFMRRDRRLYQ